MRTEAPAAPHPPPPSGRHRLLHRRPHHRASDALVRHVDALRDAVRATRAERPFRIDAWVVLPDHIHAVWTPPEGDADYSTRGAAIKARFTRSMKEDGWARRAGFSPPPSPLHVGRNGGLKPALRVRKREAGLWQRRFWEHHIRDAADLEAPVRYCWLNPVKHGLAAEPSDWPHSSWHRDHRVP